MNEPRNGFRLVEVAAPRNWSAVLLPQTFPIDVRSQQDAYRTAAEELLTLLHPFNPAESEELLLVFAQMRPDVEIPALRANARLWMPQFGMGVWLDQPPPTTWSREEFENAAPGMLRPVVERVLRVHTEPEVHRSAWQELAGSGAIIRVVCSKPNQFLPGAMEQLHGTISDPSLTSFPFYVPLLRADTLDQTWPEYNLPLEDYLPNVLLYARESVQDGGLLVLTRHSPERLRSLLERKPHGFRTDMPSTRTTV